MPGSSDAEHADVARHLLARVAPEEDFDVDELANAAYLSKARGGGRGAME